MAHEVCNAFKCYTVLGNGTIETRGELQSLVRYLTYKLGMEEGDIASCVESVPEISMPQVGACGMDEANFTRWFNEVVIPQVAVSRVKQKVGSQVSSELTSA